MFSGKLVGSIVCLVSVVVCSAAMALSSDSDQPLEIEADAAELDDIRGVIIYRGNVIVTQGSMRLYGDTMTIYYADDQKLKTIFMEGNPACFRQRPDNRDKDVEAEALRMEYHAPQKLIVLIEEATVIQGRDRFSGNRIEYDTEGGVVRARKSASGKERVKMVIQPKKGATIEAVPIIKSRCPGA